MKTQETKTTEGFAEKNIRLAFAHLMDIIDNPALLDEIPDGATIIDLPDDDPELAAFNREIGERREAEGGTVIYRRIPTSTQA